MRENFESLQKIDKAWELICVHVYATFYLYPSAKHSFYFVCVFGGIYFCALFNKDARIINELYMHPRKYQFIHRCMCGKRFLNLNSISE